MKIIVAGGRDFNDDDMMANELDLAISEGFLDDTAELVCGMAKGADLMAKGLFELLKMKVHKRPADWKDMSEPCVRKYSKYGPYNALAGFKRNHRMGNEADKLLAFWNGSDGTKDMIEYMLKLGKPVRIVYYGSMRHKKSETINEKT